MNRATADNQSAQAEDEGLEPTKEWVKDLVDEIIAEEFSSPDLELVWLSEDDNDLGKNEAALENRVKRRGRYLHASGQRGRRAIATLKACERPAIAHIMVCIMGATVAG